ncbi:RNase adapter RapZ [Limnobacter parvus]|uniref:RNase adapter RapZ n=1 Tax=Limnobacter parvus TaxID=2939690 RepID=A0ABT1XD16_9BURK|nr:RNase adapter RapZ [Limnobacter parvus]MCR2745160.1 RNase adapter RapZ [Limnobacter parvus]
MKVVLVTGLSGSGKSVAIRALEDSHFYCVDNLPPSFIPQVINRLSTEGISQIAIAADARTGRDIVDVPQIVGALKTSGTDVRILFLDADDETLVTRYSESRRRHPMSARLGEQATVQECVDAEREALEPLREIASCIDTSALLPNALRRWVLETVEEESAKLTLVFETFGFKKGLPSDADLVFDVRCLSNPYYIKNLRPLTGKDIEVQHHIQSDLRSDELINDIEAYLRKWLPSYLNEQRSYVTVAIGCTGGQHRSVYVAETLARRFTEKQLSEIESVLIRHRTLD